MKDINTLSESECIFCPNQKTKKKILDAHGKSHLWHLTNGGDFYFPASSTFEYHYHEPTGYFHYTQFLPKPQPLKKRVAKLESDYRRLNDLLPEGLQNNKFKGSFIGIDDESQAKAEETFQKLKGEEEQTIDWSVSLQLVERISDGAEFVTAGWCNAEKFAAHSVSNMLGKPFEHPISAFKPSSKTIKIE